MIQESILRTKTMSSVWQKVRRERDLGIERVKKKLISNQGLIEILLCVVKVPNDTLQHEGKLSNLHHTPSYILQHNIAEIGNVNKGDLHY